MKKQLYAVLAAFILLCGCGNTDEEIKDITGKETFAMENNTPFVLNGENEDEKYEDAVINNITPEADIEYVAISTEEIMRSLLKEYSSTISLETGEQYGAEYEIIIGEKYIYPFDSSLFEADNQYVYIEFGEIAKDVSQGVISLSQPVYVHDGYYNRIERIGDLLISRQKSDEEDKLSFVEKIFLYDDKYVYFPACWNSYEEENILYASVINYDNDEDILTVSSVFEDGAKELSLK